MWPDLDPPPKYENACEGWTDPKLPDIKLIWKLAREKGYAVGVHGSLKRDMDLIAVPWTEEAVDSEELITHLCTGLNARIIGDIGIKPHGRIAVILQIDGWFTHIDLSITPKK